MLKKVNALIKDVLRQTFSGLGKPEPLIGNYSGYCSRRITKEHRLIYKTGEKEAKYLQTQLVRDEFFKTLLTYQLLWLTTYETIKTKGTRLPLCL